MLVLNFKKVVVYCVKNNLRKAYDICCGPTPLHYQESTKHIMSVLDLCSHLGNIFV